MVLAAVLFVVQTACFVGFAQGIPGCTPSDYDYSWSPRTPTVGETVTFRVWVINPSGPCGDYSLGIRIGDAPEGSHQNYDFVFSQEYSTETSASGTWVFDVSGTYEVMAFVVTGCNCLEGCDSPGHCGWGSGTDFLVTVLPVNAPPTASFTWGPEAPHAGQVVAFDASSSTDPDENIDSYEWRFGDDTSHPSGESVTHTFAAAGRYSVKLTVEDDEGASDSVTEWITVLPANVPPVPKITATPLSAIAGIPVTFSGRSSTDSDGRVVWYGWDWTGDGVIDSTAYEITQADGTRAYAWDAANDGISDGVTATPTDYNHTYTSPGTYTVILRVRDDDGVEAQTSLVVVVAPANQPPTAQFSWSGSQAATTHAGTAVSFDGSQSRDSDGRIAAYAWDWTSDGTYDSTGAGSVVSHVFPTPGSYRVSLRVTDDDGATATTSQTLTIAPANIVPTAKYTWRGVAADGAQTASPCVGDMIWFEASTSTDSDGWITANAWDWTSDGTYDSTGTSSGASRVFSAAGTYRVTLRVTDDDGGTATTSQAITIAPANIWPSAKFSWGGGASDGARVAVEPRLGDTIRFDASGSADSDGNIVAYAWDWESEGTYDWTGAEPVVSYMFPAAGSHRVTLRVTDDDGATATTSQVVGIAERRGPVAAMAVGQEAPSILDTVQFTDSSQPGDRAIASWLWSFGDGVKSSDQHPTHQYTAKGTFSVTLTVTDTEGATSRATKTLAVVNLVPVAAATVQPDGVSIGQAITLDASASADRDGQIVGFAWDWDSDGTLDTTSAVPTAEHAFPVAGTHWVTLTVTDNDGGSASQQIVVTVSEKPVAVEPREVWAVVVGISVYAEGNDLDYARADGEAFAAWLVGASTPAEHVMTLYDSQATLARVRGALDWLRRNSQPDDLVFFYFAGHGFQGDDDNGDELDGLDEFLALYDTQTDAKDATGLRDDEFGRFLDQVNSEHVMVVFDSCFSGGQGRSLSGGTRPWPGKLDLFEDFSLEGKLVLAAASESQRSLESDVLKHGVFTYFLLEGLQGAADLDGDFRITADEAFQYAQAKVTEYAIGRGARQDPQRSGRGTSGIVMSHLNEPPQAEFRVQPPSPCTSVNTRFVDASNDDRKIASWQWAFGDGSKSTEQTPTHLYAEPGNYLVTLTVADEDGAEGTFEQSIVVGPPGEVTSIGDKQIAVSLGSQHGVAVGDVFDVVRVLPLSSGQKMVEHRAIAEIVEIIGPDRSAARIIRQEFPIELHDILRASGT
jgi:PKD repeat protein